eukprot:403373812
MNQGVDSSNISNGNHQIINHQNLNGSKVSLVSHSSQNQSQPIPTNTKNQKSTSNLGKYSNYQNTITSPGKGLKSQNTSKFLSHNISSPNVEQEYQNQESQSIKETNHILKLNDAITRNKIRKTERDCDQLKLEQQKVQKVISKVEKQHNTDQQYLIKQKELEARYELDFALLKMKQNVQNESQNQNGSQKSNNQGQHSQMTTDASKDIRQKLLQENQNLQKLQEQMQHSQFDSQQCLFQLGNIENLLNQSTSQQSQTMGHQNQTSSGYGNESVNSETLNQVIIEVMDVYEKSIKRKNGEIDMIKSCLVKEKQKLIDEKENVMNQVQLLRQKRVEQQKQLCDLQKKNEINQRATLVDLLISNNLTIDQIQKQQHLYDVSCMNQKTTMMQQDGGSIERSKTVNKGQLDDNKPVQTISIDLGPVTQPPSNAAQSNQSSRVAETRKGNLGKSLTSQRSNANLAQTKQKNKENSHKSTTRY